MDADMPTLRNCNFQGQQPFASQKDNLPTISLTFFKKWVQRQHLETAFAQLGTESVAWTFYYLQMEVINSTGSASASARTMSSSSTCSMDSSKKSLAKISKASTTNNSTRSSVSSMNSTGSSFGSNQNNNLNHALAMVTNQLEREQRKHDQEATRKLTLLRQRKISAVLKVIDLSLF